MERRYDFVFLFEVSDGNPNGDPDAGNLPRIDPETGHGLVTDVCLKRKVRNYIALAKGEEPPYAIYVKEKAILNLQNKQAYQALELEPVSKRLPKKLEDAYKVTNWMCQNFYDVRTFGAVMTTDINCGQVRGPVQLTFARSIDPVISLEHCITRCAVTTEKESEAQQGGNQTMGRKFTIPYALYRCHGYINPFLAAKTGFSEDDLECFWEALRQMFELDRSAARGQMAPRGLIVFEHESKLGSAPAHALQDRVGISLKAPAVSPRSFGDYTVSIEREGLPEGIKIHELL